MTSPTVYDHARLLLAAHGPGPWPDGGDPLPDEAAEPGAVRFAAGALDGIMKHHSRELPDSRDVPALSRDQLREQALDLVRTGRDREDVKRGLVLLGESGDERDRGLLILIGTLEHFTEQAVTALRRTQVDADQAICTLGRRVAGWGRIAAVDQLEGTADPEIRAWLLRDGFRNDIDHGYLAITAATTGGLLDALTAGTVDAELFDGAGEILSSLVGQDGPGPTIADYPDGEAALRAYAALAAAREPTLEALRAAQAILSFLDGWAMELPLASRTAELREPYLALTGRPGLREMVLAHLADPASPDFWKALEPADSLGLKPFAQVFAQLTGSTAAALNSWYYATKWAAPGEAEALVALADRRFPPGDDSWPARYARLVIDPLRQA
ncbi:hypothetical protein [Amycolatopsis sp. H20-H5]|uniref:hypothetical protein n=1 Tax=Amycolatopsis sp. H20-H5 TaxID=3046309 RepID=UPI002DBB5BDA|nr:hypothetical protein [Amycolatopsis sp. H20-H5]MEC3980795.1 hypothetical protein [Amycolatopsis sp. H20-H5]